MLKKKKTHTKEYLNVNERHELAMKGPMSAPQTEQKNKFKKPQITPRHLMVSNISEN